MRMVLLGSLLICAAVPAVAQVTTPALPSSVVSAGPSGMEANGAASLRAGGNPLAGTLETPTMRREKLARAVALRDEALKLQAEDGGTLTEAHARYVQRRARNILAYTNIRPGTWVASPR